MRETHTHVFVNDILGSYRRLHVSRSGVVLAVSGGADSLALMLATAELREALELDVTVASVDHGLRPEAAGEVARVSTLAAQNALKFQALSLGLRDGPALEERARAARYGALESLRKSVGARWIVTAHTANDQAETLLMRL